MLSNQEDLVIVVDQREFASGIVAELEKDQLFAVRKASLSCGDYLVGDLQFQQRYVLLGLPGIGLKRADALLKQFGSLGQVFMASEQELAQTPEVGPGVAKKIKEILMAGFRVPAPGQQFE